jgi:hypothetical protein
MLLESNYGIDWASFPKPGATAAQQVSAQLEICTMVTSEMDSLSLTLRANIDTETEQGPDFIITTRSNGWARFRLSNWPVLQILSAQVSPASATPPCWTTIPLDSLMSDHSGITLSGTIVPSGATPGPSAVLIAPGYVTWANGRNGYLVQVTTITGFPVCGIDQPAIAGATSLHVDDITGWWNGVNGAAGTLYDVPLREQVAITGATPDIAGAVSGAGTLTLSQGLRFAHTPAVGVTGVADQRILLSSFPATLLQAGFYLATYYGLIRGATGAVMQSSRGQASPSGTAGANDWHSRAVEILSRFARTL